MMKSIRTLVRQDREKYVIPRRVQDVIPIQKIWEDGIFLTGGRYAKTFRFTDINYQVASESDKSFRQNTNIFVICVWKSLQTCDIIILYIKIAFLQEGTHFCKNASVTIIWLFRKSPPGSET